MYWLSLNTHVVQSRLIDKMIFSLKIIRRIYNLSMDKILKLNREIHQRFNFFEQNEPYSQD